MDELSLVVRNARIVDGSGLPGFHGDVGVKGDRIVAVGEVRAKGAMEIDADGKVLAPGFIDIHTHYDPQLCWDGMASPSPEHGVTTLVAGNCSLSLAPVRPGGQRKITSLFGVVEDLEADYFDAAVPYDWETFGEYLDFIRPNLGPNVGVLVGHAALRLYVMGEDAQERAASKAEIEEMCALLREAILAGALGLSLTYGHIDELGGELPTFYAEDAELTALCQVMAQIGRGIVECAADFRSRRANLMLIDRLGALAERTGVTVSLSPILHTPHMGDAWLRQLLRVESWRSRGVKLYVQTQTRPLDQAISLARGSVALTKLPTWSSLLTLPMQERIVALADRSRWEVLDEEIKRARGFFDALVVASVKAEANKAFEGRKVTEIAQTTGRTYTEAMLEIALADGLETEFEVKDFIHADPEAVSLLLTHPAVQIGSADAGAHVGQFSGAGDTCFLFEKFVRKLGYMSVEQAVQRLTSDLAGVWGLTDRGQIAEGRFADLVIFDPDTIARGPEIWQDDLPGGGGRFIRHAVGVHTVVVNGQVLVQDGAYSDARPGRVV